MSEITSEQYLALCETIDLYRDEMGLKDWSLTIAACEPHDEKNMAEAESFAPYKNATFRFKNEFWDLPAADQRVILLHELMHIKVASMKSLVYYDLENILEPQTYALLVATLEREEEGLVEDLAHALTKTYKLPKLKKGTGNAN